MTDPQPMTKGWLEEMRENGELKRPNLDVKPLPETESGWTKVRSNVVVGFKCDHYEKGDQALRVFWKDNGDFITLDEDPDGLAREPEVQKGYVGDTTGICSKGPWRLHIEDNGQEVDVIGGFPVYGDHKGYAIMYPNGNGFGGIMQSAPGYMIGFNHKMAITWENFKTGKKMLGTTGEKYITTITRKVSLHGNHDWIYLSSNPKEIFPSCGLGFVVGNRVYDLNPKTQSLTPAVGQYINDFVYPTTGNDSIVSVEKVDHSYEKLTYANGDYVVTDIKNRNSGRKEEPIYGGVQSGVLHRAGGILKIKENNRFILTLPDGRIFAGRLAHESCIPGTPLYRGHKDATDDSRGGNNAQLILGSELQPWTGDFELADGTIEHLEMGWSSKQLAEAKAKEAKQEEEQKKQEVAAKQKAQQDLYNKYGKKYVDALLNDGKILVGCPIGLLKDKCWIELSSNNGTAQVYHLYSQVSNYNRSGIIGDKRTDWTHTIWVRNGRVTSIRDYTK